MLKKNGEMSEWFMELVLKTSDTARYRRFESYSLRHKLFGDIPKFGRRGSPAKGVDWKYPVREFKSLCLRQKSTTFDRELSIFTYYLFTIHSSLKTNVSIFGK